MTNIIYFRHSDGEESVDVSESETHSPTHGYGEEASGTVAGFTQTMGISRMNCFGFSASSPYNNKSNGGFPNPQTYVEKQLGTPGWPSWLSSAAPDAIKDWYPRRADSFQKLETIWEGSHSDVYKATDASTGRIVALKKVRFQNLNHESVKSMAREILILRCLDHPNVIKLEGLVFIPDESCNLYLVFEYMEHDLADLTLIHRIKLTEPQVKCYMNQLLSGLDHCHSRGVVHANINESNLFLGKGGILKIAGFGSASFSNHTLNQSMTIGVETLWYRAPEFLPGRKNYDVSVDLWSTGCVLAELLAMTPIVPRLKKDVIYLRRSLTQTYLLKDQVENLHNIFKLFSFSSSRYLRCLESRSAMEIVNGFPPSSLSLIETLMAINPVERQTAAVALRSEFFAVMPYACNPLSLPQCPPMKGVHDFVIKEAREFRYID